MTVLNADRVAVPVAVLTPEAGRCDHRPASDLVCRA